MATSAAGQNNLHVRVDNSYNENMVTTSNFEVLEVDLNGAMRNYLRLPSLVLLSPFLVALLYRSYQRLCRKLLYMYSMTIFNFLERPLNLHLYLYMYVHVYQVDIVRRWKKRRK